MLNTEQINLETSFILIEPNTPLVELKNKILQYQFAVITGERHYTITNSEYNFILSGADSKPVILWLEEMQWIPSTVLTMSEILELSIDWRRPVLIKNEEKENIIGVLTASEWIQSLQIENKKITAYFHTLAETVNDAVTAIDQEGKVICWNTPAEGTYGIKRENILGRKIGEYFLVEDIVLHRILNEGCSRRNIA